MDAFQQLVIEAECAGLMLRFFRALDERDHTACAELMADDGVWERTGTSLRGSAQVREALDQRAPGRRTCHSISSVIATVLDERHCRVQFFLTAYEGKEGADAQPPIARLAGIRSCIDEMELTGRGWRIASKTSKPVFAGPPAT